MSTCLFKCPSCGKWFGMRREEEEVLEWDEVSEKTSRFPVRRYRRVEEFLSAETIERTVRCVCKVERRSECRNCGWHSVVRATRTDSRVVAQLPSSKVVEPFGEVNVWFQPDGAIRIKATILKVPNVKGAQTGLAVDGSVLLQNAFCGGKEVSGFSAPSSGNGMDPVVRALASYLATFASNGMTNVVYWACGCNGDQVQELGEMNAATLKMRKFIPPRHYGSGAKLLPAVKHFAETICADSPWSLFVIINHRIIEDLPDVQRYSRDLAKQLAAGERKFLKLVLIGVGSGVDEAQMASLDDLDYGGLKTPAGEPIDIWDYKLASEMQMIEEVFAEVVSARTMVAPFAEVLDSSGRPVQPIGRASYGSGLPALLEFRMPAGSTAFTVVWPEGNRVVQKIA